MGIRDVLRRTGLAGLIVGLCCLVAPMPAVSQAYLDNETLYSNQDVNTETRRSDHFRFCFGHYNRDTGAPMTEALAQGNLQMFEHMWDRWVTEMGLHDINESVTKPDGKKYKTNFNVLMTWNDGGGGGAYSSMDGNGFFYAMANTTYCSYDPPSGATPHEMGHAWEGSCGGFNGSDSSGAWWECTANWMQLQFLNVYPQAGGLIWNSMYYPCHGRDYYDAWAIWEAAREDPRYGPLWINRVWTDATPAQAQSEYIIDRMVRVDTSGSPDKAGANRDLWGDMAKKCVTWDFERQRWLAQANTPESDPNWWYWYQRCRTPLVKVPSMDGWYRPTQDHVPQEYGFNTIPLAVSANTTISCDFQPICDPVRQSDWRACLVAVSDNGDARYSCLWNAGTNSMTLSGDEKQAYLVVIATPKPMKVGEKDEYRRDSGSQFPYQVSFTNAAPKNVVFPKPSGSWKTRLNPDGSPSGAVASTATVDATAYVGPNAMVLNYAKVLGNARVEDYAVVRNNAQVRDNAVVSGHAMVQDNAQVYGNAKVRDWARVFGWAEVYENGKVIEHGNCGDGDSASHTKVYGNAVVKGTTYVYNPSTIAGCSIWEGDTANGGTLVEHGVTFGWSWGFDTAYFNSLTDNKYIYAQHTFEKDHPVWAWDEYGINHGYLMNGAKAVKDTVAPTRGGRVLALDGVRQYVELHPSINDWKETAIALWVKWSGTKWNGITDDQKIFSMGDGAAKSMYLTPMDSQSGSLKFVISNGVASQSLVGSDPLQPNVWTHVAIVFSGSVSTLYVNGAAVASNPATTIFPDGLNAPLMENANYLGRDSIGNYFYGYIDDFRVYSKALGASDIAAIYAAPAPAAVSIPADTTAPTPNAASWLVTPEAISDSAVTMSATPGTDASGWVEYYFDCTTEGGHDSGWVSFNKYTDVGLSPGTYYSYTVKMRDKDGNTTSNSAEAGATTQTASIVDPAFSYGPVGIANGQIKMVTDKLTSPSGLVEYKFDCIIPGVGTIGSSGWQSSTTWVHTGLTAGTSYAYRVTARDARGNVSAASAPVSALAKDMAAPILPMAVAHWNTQPYATIDNKISMTAMSASDPAAVQYYFHCVSGGGPDSGWQDSSKFTTGALPDGTYVYQYKIRDKSPQYNESGYSVTSTAIVSPYRGYHNYTLSQLAGLPDDTLVRFTGVITAVNSNNYIVTDLQTNANIKVYPNTNAMVTDPNMLFKNVNVDGHLWAFGGIKCVTYSTVTATGGGSTLQITGNVSNVLPGVPIAGATVFFSLSPNSSANPVCTATTDQYGNYSRTVVDGTWYVSASAADYYPSAEQNVVVRGKSVGNIDFALNMAPRVTGMVMDVAGVGIPGATVYFSKTANAGTDAIYKARTDTYGRYFRGLPDGTWYLAATAPGYANSVERSVVVTSAGLNDVDFTLNLGGDGLKGEYFDNNNFTTLKVTRVDPAINFTWDGVAADPSMGVDTFTVRWTGQVKPKYTQTYTFYTTSDDGVRLWVNDQLLVDNWTIHGSTVNSGTISLTANQWYSIKMEYWQEGGGAVAKLEWSSSSQGRQVIPQSQLWSSSAPGQLVYGQVTDDTGSPVAGSTVYFSASPNASLGFAYSATTDFHGRYSKTMPNGSWYVAAGKSGYITSADRHVTVNNADVPDVSFAITPTVIPFDVVYNFDETSGNTALDSSGSGKNGTLANGPAWIAGKVGNAVEFDGVNDYVSVPPLMEYNALTIAGWVNMDSFGADSEGSSIISSDGWEAGDIQLAILKDSGRLGFAINGNLPTQLSSTTGFTAADLGSWRHVAVVYESAPGTVKFYINGGLQGVKSFSISRTALLTSMLRIGGWSGGRYFDGKIDEFSIYRRALSGDEIVNMVAAGAPVSIGAAKKLGDGELVAFAAKPVTYAPRDSASARSTSHFYIQEPDMSAGIRVSSGAAGLDSANPGYAASVAGYMATVPSTGERYIELAGPAVMKSAGGLEPFAMNTKSIMTGATVPGMLVRVAGSVKSMAADRGSLMLSDGYSVPVKVVSETGSPIARIKEGNFVIVNGVVSKEAGETGSACVILLRGITRVLPVDNGTHAHYKMDETTGTVAADSSGADLNATLFNGPTWVAGKYGNAVNLDGSNDYLGLPSGIVAGMDDFTISAWVKLDAVTTNMRIFDFGTGTSNYMALTPKHSNTSGKIRFAIASGGSTQYITGTGALATGAWKHVVITRSGNTGILYINGAEVSRNTSLTLKPSSLGTTNLNYIGKSQTSSHPYLDGLVDDFRIYGKALSATEVTQLYNGQLN